MKPTIAKISHFTTALLLLFTLAAQPANAFSSYGAGTTADPYRIGTCAQLGEIAANLAGAYTLIRDIDCQGVSFVSIGDAGHLFTGSLDGRGYSIYNLSISAGATDSVGLFAGAFGATITNLALASPHVTGRAFVAALVGDAENGTTITKVRVTSPVVSGSGNNVGGLVGEAFGAAVSQSSVTSGSVTSTGANTGGLVGRDNQNTTVTDSYAATAVTGGAFGNTGGLIGQVKTNAGLITRTYAAGSVSGPVPAGGLVGLFINAKIGVPILLSNSFSAANVSGITGGPGNAGGFIGQNIVGDVFSGIFYDKGRGQAPSLSCIGGGVGTCTTVDATSTDLDHFVGTSTAAPLTNWNFTDTWQATSGNFPTLVPLSNLASGSLPNAGDANGDALADHFQPNVISVPDSNGAWTTIEVPSTSGCSVDYPQWADPTAHDLPYIRQTATMTAFKLYCTTPGATVPVTLIYDQHYDTTDWMLRYYNATTQAYTTVPGAVFGARTIGGVTKTTVTYSLTDGGSFDADGAANGLIDDPVAPAAALGVPNTGLGGLQPDQKPWPEAILWLILSLTGLAWVMRRLQSRLT